MQSVPLNVELNITELWLNIESDISIEQAVQQAEELGYKIKQIDKENRRIQCQV